MKRYVASKRVMVLAAFAWLSPLMGGDFFQHSPSIPPRPEIRPLNSSFAIIFDSRANIIDRVNRVHWLGKDLSLQDVCLLYDFLAKLPEVGEANLAGLRFLKNEVWTLLRNQKVPPPDFTQRTIGIIQDLRQDTVIRDYAMQHLITWYEQGAADAPDARARIRTALIQISRQNQDTSLGVTALLALEHLSELGADEAIRQEKPFDFVGDAALRVAASDKASVAMRVTAIQICALRGRKELLPLVESLADATAEPALQISAIAALGKLGEPKDAALLRQLEARQDEVIRPAIVAALKQLDHPLLARRSLNESIP